jgi:hypothetical protein
MEDEQLTASGRGGGWAPTAGASELRRGGGGSLARASESGALGVEDAGGRASGGRRTGAGWGIGV